MRKDSYEGGETFVRRRDSCEVGEIGVMRGRKDKCEGGETAVMEERQV